MKTKHEIIDETVKFYEKDPENRRAGNAITGCFYFLEGRHCAVGRCLNKNGLKRLDGFLGDVVEVALTDKDLKPSYRGHSLKFWERLQGLHDLDENWTNEGLSEIGKEAVRKLKKNFK